LAEEKDEKPAEQEPKKPEEPKDEDYKEKFLRLAAEFDNYKKRVKTEIEAAKCLGKAELAKSLLPVLDEFELAVATAGGSSDKTLAKGIELLYSNFYDVMKKCGLSEIPVGEAFDPYKHEIIMVQEDEKLKPGTIIEVAKKGYALGGIMLRPAVVIVAKEKEVKKGGEGDEKKNDV
jgi:molecular chaperone GrpE